MDKPPDNQDEGTFKDFIRGFWQMPDKRPNYFYSFLRGAIVSVIVSIFTRVRDLREIILMLILVGLFWAAIDHIIWKRFSKIKKE